MQRAGCHCEEGFSPAKQSFNLICEIVPQTLQLLSMT